MAIEQKNRFFAGDVTAVVTQPDSGLLIASLERDGPARVRVRDGGAMPVGQFLLHLHPSRFPGLLPANGQPARSIIPFDAGPVRERLRVPCMGSVARSHRRSPSVR